VEAAKKSGPAQNILKNKAFQECLAIGAGVALGHDLTQREGSDRWEFRDDESKLNVVIDLSLQPSDMYPSPVNEDRMIIMITDIDADGGGDGQGTPSFTYHDNYDRYDRIPYETCGNFPDDLNDQITLLQTWNGCCKYYNDKDCKTGLFSQYDREDNWLKEDHSNAVTSYWWTFDSNCAGGP
jgi:hypothetical protein